MQLIATHYSARREVTCSSTCRTALERWPDDPRSERPKAAGLRCLAKEQAERVLHLDRTKWEKPDQPQRDNRRIVTQAVTSALLIAGSLVTIVAAISAGALSDWIGRKKTYLLFGVLNVILLPMFYLALAHQPSMGAVWAYSLAIAFLGNAAYAPTLIFLNERFPTALRASGTGLSWNVGFAIGGLMPTFVSLASGPVEGLPAALAIFLAGGFMIYLIGAIVIPETKRR